MKVRVIASVALLVAAGTLGGCASRAEIAEQQGNYLSPDGTISQIAIENRDKVIDFAGPDEKGELVESSDYLGQIVVVNFWYASCPPCRMEAPWLQELSDEFAPDNVQFIGVNVRDDPATSSSFTEKFGITYPSIMDEQEAEVTMAFAGVAPPTAVPTTIVLDRQGRFAARIVGIIDKSVLRGLIDSALEEDSSAP